MVIFFSYFQENLCVEDVHAILFRNGENGENSCFDKTTLNGYIVFSMGR